MSVDVTQSTWLGAGVHAPSRVTSHRQYRPWNIQPRGDLSPGLSKHIHQCKLVLCVHNLRQIRTKCKTKLRVDQWFTAKNWCYFNWIICKISETKNTSKCFSEKKKPHFHFHAISLRFGGTEFTRLNLAVIICEFAALQRVCCRHWLMLC